MWVGCMNANESFNNSLPFTGQIVFLCVCITLAGYPIHSPLGDLIAQNELKSEKNGRE